MKNADGIIVNAAKEKMTLMGVESLSDIELLILILKTGDELKDVRTLSEQLIRRYTNLDNISSLSVEKLTRENKGLSQSKAIELKCALELGRRSLCAKAKQSVIHSSSDIAKIVSPLLKNKDKEHFMVAHLNTKSMLLSLETVSVGTLNQSTAHAREIFKSAITNSAYGIILIHNHPSTDTEPSEADLETTQKICAAGRIIGIKVLDHIIIGGDDYFSFADEGIMPDINESLFMLEYDKLA